VNSDTQHVLRPGFSLLAGSVFAVCATIADTWLDLMVLSTLVVFAAFVVRVTTAQLVRGVISARWLLSIAAIIHAGFRLWFVHVEGSPLSDVVTHTAFFLMRLLLLLAGFQVVLTLHSPVSYMTDLAKRLSFVFGKQFAGQTAQVSLMAFAMLPHLRHRLEQRQMARRLRGIKVTGLDGRLLYARSEFQAAMRHALQYADSLAIVLWSRGFRPELGIMEKPEAKTSWAAFAGVVLFCLLCLSTLFLKPTG